MSVFAKTPKGYRVRIEREPIGTACERGSIFYGNDGPKLSSWDNIPQYANVQKNRTPEAALTQADERIEAMGLSEIDEEPRDSTIRFRTTASEHATLQQLASDAGVTVSQYIRSKIFAKEN